MDYEKSGGKLVQVEGTVTDVLYDAAGTGVSQFWLDDGSGVNANIFIDGYIFIGNDRKRMNSHRLCRQENACRRSAWSCTSGGNLRRGSTHLRVRNCDEIVEVTSGETPDDTETPGNTETREQIRQTAEMTARTEMETVEAAA